MVTKKNNENNNEILLCLNYWLLFYLPSIGSESQRRHSYLKVLVSASRKWKVGRGSFGWYPTWGRGLPGGPGGRWKLTIRLVTELKNLYTG